MLISRFESGWQTKHLAGDVLQKSAFADAGIIMFHDRFFMILDGFWLVFMIGVALETALKFNDFSG